MTDPWYDVVKPGTPLTQGDIIKECPVLVWNAKASSDPANGGGSSLLERLQGLANAEAADVVVMTQACDLEQGNVSNVVLCSHYALDEFRNIWEQDRLANNKKANNDSWKTFCKSVKQGFAWGLSLLNEYVEGEATTQVRIVNFQDIHTIPREFLELLLAERSGQRLQLRSPYREHLSQSFARFFMRVGLPTAVVDAWEKPQKI